MQDEMVTLFEQQVCNDKQALSSWFKKLAVWIGYGSVYTVLDIQQQYSCGSTDLTLCNSSI